MLNRRDNISKVLIVDDEIKLLETLAELMKIGGFEVVTASDGIAALAVLEASNGDIDVIVLDRNMPNMDGFELLKIMKGKPAFKHIPAIFQTARGAPEDVVAGLELGAFYYITKPYDVKVLFAIAKSAIDDQRRLTALKQEVQDRDGAISLIKSGTFRFSTMEEAGELASLLAVACPNSDDVAIGLQELFLNAVEHGNLEISYAQKKNLLIADEWGNEIKRRLATGEYKDRIAEVQFKREVESITFTIKDEGAGFLSDQYFEFDPLRAMDPNGRGIAMANSISFSGLEYLGCGNEVVATVLLQSEGI